MLCVKIVPSMTKLLYVANARIPTERAHGIQIVKMCEAFAKAGLSVELVVPKRMNWIKENPFSYYAVEKNFKITKLPCLDLIPYHKILGNLGLWIESVSFNFFAFPYAFFKKADIIYTRDKFFLPLALLKGNLVFETHGFSQNHFLYDPLFKRLKKIVSITQKLKDLFQEQGIASDRILVAADGVDLERFNVRETQEECRNKLGLPIDKKIVLYTGHLYDWKGTQVLAQASDLLPAEIYFVGGTKEDVQDFKVKDPNLKIKIIGHRPYSEIPCWLRAADVLVLPNSGKEEISKHWTSPLKLFEYMAASKPIVASDLPSIREILNKDNAILVAPDNPEALAEGINKALTDKGLSARISVLAYEGVKNYTWQKRAEKVLKFILEK